MSYATDKWFSYIRNDVLTEGIRDLGLPEVVIDRIESGLSKAPEKTKTWMGHQWKDTSARNLRGWGPQGNAGTTRQDFGLHLLNLLVDYSDESSTGWKNVSPEDAKEKSKSVRYVLANIYGADGMLVKKPFGAWNKGFKKALKNLSKIGVDSDTVERVNGAFQALFTKTYEMFYRQYDDVFTLLNLDPTNFEYIKSENIDEASTTAREYIENREEPDQILHTFDDGSYWYDIQTSNCSIEAERMGHCGDAQHSHTLLSLRKKEKRQKHSKSYVTVEYGEDHATIYQIKGRSNSVPPEETWGHIAWLVDDLGVGTIEETGEHSNEDFSELLQYLQQHTNAEIGESREERVEELQEQLNEIAAAHEGDSMEGADYSVWAEVYDDWGDPGDPVYYNGGGELTLEVNLGWPAMQVSEKEYVPMDLNGNELPTIERIPVENAGWSAVREFQGESGILDVAYEGPGEEEEVDYTIKMLQPAAHPGWEMGDAEPANIAMMRITIRSTQEASDDADNFDYFATEIQSMAENHKELQQKIRMKLVEEGYAMSTPFDTARKETEKIEKDLDNFTVYNDGGELEFWFNPIVNDKEQRHTQVKSPYTLPNDVFYYADDNARSPAVRFRQMFANANPVGRGRGQVQIQGDQLNNMMARQLTAQYAQARRNDNQQEFEFGQVYKAPPPPTMELARDLRFIVEPVVSYFAQGGGLDTVNFWWRFTVGIDPTESQEEVDRTLNFIKYLNENPKEIINAANELIDFAAEPMIERAEKNKEDILNGTLMSRLLDAVERRYGERAHSGDNEAEKATLIAHWIKENWDDMNDIEKTVAVKDYVYKMSQGALALVPINVMDQGAIGLPSGWDSSVKDEMQYRGAPSQVRNNYRSVGAPAIAADVETNDGAYRSTVELEENINLEEELPSWIETPERYEENQLHRVEKLLEKLRDPAHDLRIYNIQVGCNLIDRVGGTDAEIAAQIRGIDGVTTVRPIADSKRDITPTETYVLFDIKFELLGATSRVEFRDEVLIPQMRLIDGIKIINWSAIHKTNIQGTVRTVREAGQKLEEYGFGTHTGGSMGGVAQNLGTVRLPKSAPRPTPTPTLDAIAQDWAQGGVQVYDFPTNTNDMRYHTMLPTAELWELTSRINRYPKDIFDIKHQRFDAVYQRLKDKLEDPAAYHEFIKDGATAPVYVAIGQNGKIKITGNEDLVWFAKKSGLEELPVFLSYQRQI